MVHAPESSHPTAAPDRGEADVQQIVEAVASVVGPHEGMVPLHAPDLAGNAWDYVKQCIDTGWISSAGAFVSRFEQDVASYTGARHAVAVVNGTAALHIALLLAGVGRGDEVLMPSLTFVATANAASYCGATPHFVDVSQRTLGLDPQALQTRLDDIAERRDGAVVNRGTGNVIAAIVPMHTFGHPVDLDGVLAVAQRWGLPVVEDAAESLGSFYRGKHTGTFGKLGTLSFNGNKILSTGGGGMILTDDEALADRARHLTTTAKVPHAWDYVHDAVGYNYRMPNINAALGVAQLEQIDDRLASKRRLAQRYADAMSTVPGVTMATEPKDCRSNHWLNAIMLDENRAQQRDPLLAALNEAGLQSRPIWRPMHELPMCRQSPKGDLEATVQLSQSVINVPSSAVLG
jgi:perosamine synthetase